GHRQRLLEKSSSPNVASLLRNHTHVLFARHDGVFRLLPQLLHALPKPLAAATNAGVRIAADVDAVGRRTGPYMVQRRAARPLGIVSAGAANVVAQIVPATTPLGPAASPLNLLAIQAADPDPAAAFATYELPSAADSAAVAAATTVAAPVVATTTEPTALPTGTLLAARPAARFLVQAGTFADEQNAQAMRAHLLALDPNLAVELRAEAVEGKTLNRVLIGQLDSWLAAETVRRRLQAWGVSGLVRQLPNQPLVAVNEAVAGPPAAP
nr:hypothetical protein [Tanacetum cinerariifolium]